MKMRALTLAAALFCTPAFAADMIDGAHFGPIRVVVPQGDVDGYAVLFSGESGWTADDDKALSLLQQKGVLAAGVDTKVYLSHIAALLAGPNPPACLQFGNDIEGLSKQLQRLHPSKSYLSPILVGRGAGGTLAYAALAQAPANTLAGAISLDPATSFATPAPPCFQGGARMDEQGRYVPRAVQNLHGFWTVALDGHATAREKDRIRNLQVEGVPVDIREISGDDDASTIASIVTPHLTRPARGDVASLPLIELPADKPSRLLAVVLSGDGGWRDIDKSIAEVLQKNGVAVIGFDCLRYFWWKKMPDQAAADLSEVLTEYSAKWGTDRIALIGYSFGADVLPAIYDRLPPSLRGKIALVSLLGLESKADWEIRVSGWLGAPPSAAATPVAPELAKIPAQLIQCYYGVEDHASACTSLLAPPAELIATRGGHHFGQDYVTLARDIRAGFEKRAAQ
jgi:type IV secretory pathway VirJ component